MEKIEPGKYVELGYDLYEVNGDEQTLVHQTDDNDPERIVFGVTRGMIEPLESYRRTCRRRHFRYYSESRSGIRPPRSGAGGNTSP